MTKREQVHEFYNNSIEGCFIFQATLKFSDLGHLFFIYCLTNICSQKLG